LDDLQARDTQLRGLAEEIRQTMAASTGLAKELTGTLQAVDRVVARFDHEAGSDRKPLEIKDLRDAATEGGKAAEKLTALLQQSNEVAKSGCGMSGWRSWTGRRGGRSTWCSGAHWCWWWCFWRGCWRFGWLPQRVRAVKGS
jgi:hypothetical protein